MSKEQIQTIQSLKKNSDRMVRALSIVGQFNVASLIAYVAEKQSSNPNPALATISTIAILGFSVATAALATNFAIDQYEIHQLKKTGKS